MSYVLLPHMRVFALNRESKRYFRWRLWQCLISIRSSVCSLFLKFSVIDEILGFAGDE